MFHKCLDYLQATHLQEREIKEAVMSMHFSNPSKNPILFNETRKENARKERKEEEEED